MSVTPNSFYSLHAEIMIFQILKGVVNLCGWNVIESNPNVCNIAYCEHQIKQLLVQNYSTKMRHGTTGVSFNFTLLLSLIGLILWFEWFIKINIKIGHRSSSLHLFYTTANNHTPQLIHLEQ